MFTAKKLLTVALVALTVAGAGVATTGSAMAGGGGFPHPHHHHHGAPWGWGAGGLAAGLVIGSALAARPVYVEPVRKCWYVERTNRWGEVIGTRKVCRFED